MLSSNNQKSQVTQQRFSLRKLTVGVASVLIGLTFMGVSGTVHADTNNDSHAAVSQPVKPKPSSENSNVAATANDGSNVTTTFTANVTLNTPDGQQTVPSQTVAVTTLGAPSQANLLGKKFKDVTLPSYIGFTPQVAAPGVTVAKEGSNYVLKFSNLDLKVTTYNYVVDYVPAYAEYTSRESVSIYGPDNNDATGKSDFYGDIVKKTVNHTMNGKQYTDTWTPVRFENLDLSAVLSGSSFTNSDTGMHNQSLPQYYGYHPVIERADISHEYYEGIPGYSNAQGTAAAEKLHHDLNSYLASHPDATALPAFTIDGPLNVNFIIHYVKDPISIAYDPDDAAMNRYVTRTIAVSKPGSTKSEVVTQIIHFVRGGAGQTAGTADENGHITWTPWTVADKDNKSTGKTVGSWAQYDIAQIDNYTSTVDGKASALVAANDNVTADTASITVKVAYSQNTKTLEPTDPAINPNKPCINSDMFIHPTRTINVVVDSATGKTETTTQTVWFGRTKTISSDSNVKPTYGEWQLGKVENGKFIVDPDGKAEWPEFTAPTINGYTPKLATIEKQKVTPETKDVTVTIIYDLNNNGEGITPTQGQATIIYRDPDGNEIRRTIILGVEGTTTDPSTAIKNNLPSGYKLKDGYQIPTVAAISSTIEVLVVPANKENCNDHQDDNDDQTKPGSDKNQNSNTCVDTLDSTDKEVGSKNTKDDKVGANCKTQVSESGKKLPQTGGEENYIGILGLAIASLAGLFGLKADKKRRNN